MANYATIKYVGPQYSVSVPMPDGSFEDVPNGGSFVTTKEHADLLLSSSSIWKTAGKASEEDFLKAAGDKEAQEARVAGLTAQDELEQRRIDAQKAAEDQ